ncbi:hypothetical protein Tco_1297931 [Tanacetum coccineum]
MAADNGFMNLEQLRLLANSNLLKYQLLVYFDLKTQREVQLRTKINILTRQLLDIIDERRSFIGELEQLLSTKVMPYKTSNYGVTCEDKAKRRNSGTKMKTFEENCYLLLYAVSSIEDTAYQCQLITRTRVMINSRYGVSLFTYTPYAQLVISQRYEVNVIGGN